MAPPLSKREFTKRRHAQSRDLVRACRAIVAGTGWKSRQGVLFTHRDGWFIAVHEMTNLLHERTQARVAVKPMATDPVFWDMVGHPELRRQGLSFRYFGAMTTGALILEEPEIPEQGGPHAIARRMLELGEQVLDRISRTWTVDDFLAGIAGRGGRYYTATIATLIAYGREAEAGRLSATSVAAGSSGGFISSKLGTFNEMTARAVAQRTAVDNPS